MRLDVYLQQNGFAESRERAKRLVANGDVTVDGVVVTKPSYDVIGTPEIAVREPKFVGRGGEKLEGALQLFNNIIIAHKPAKGVNFFILSRFFA